MLHAMIMAGGGGTRFWPRSRSKRPKQFLTFSGDRTLLQSTVDRIAAQVPAERTWVITGDAHRGTSIEQLKELPADHIVGEPQGRDTAACIGLGAALIARVDADATMMVMPADHLIEPVAEFGRAALAAEHFANEYPNALLTFGIPPTYPATGYGYIKRGKELGARNGVPIAAVEEFKEKPDFETAEKYVASGKHYWNSGIFVWKPTTILAELKRQKPDLFARVSRIADAWDTPRRADVFQTEYANAEKISIDFAVMQEAAEVLVIHAPYKWDDVGSWLALERNNPQDASGNTVQGLHYGVETERCVVAADPGRLIATIGVKDLVIVQCGNATLIADRKKEADVKKIVDQLKDAKQAEYL
ncbi:MAG TPA: mannose-1-phosphate guanylyltransferase [Gemmataceae bacterium]|nr:mannose-1-phosphate guanylyltransferase [Gemmataceae bacterium]